VTAYHRAKLDALIRKVNRLADEYGKKAALAKYLSISRQQLNAWLSGEREPSGGITLHLLEWVTAEEGKQKTPASADNTHKGKQTRKRKRTNESKSGPPKSD
jgi:transcriptional regulator with XRE-family HTH domain